MINFNEVRKVAVWSLNPVKIDSVKHVLDFYLSQDIEVVWLSAPSGVSDMPMTLKETERWAYNRAKRCIDQWEFDMVFGLEWGAYQDTTVDGRRVLYMTWDVAICDSSWYLSVWKWPSFALPPFLIQPLLDWWELWPLMDQYTWISNIKKKWWTNWYLTNNYLTRIDAFANIVVQAIVPRLHPDLYA